VALQFDLDFLLNNSKPDIYKMEIDEGILTKTTTEVFPARAAGSQPSNCPEAGVNRSWGSFY